MIVVKSYGKLLPPPELDEHNMLVEREFNAKDGLAILKAIEWKARISHRTEDKVTADSYDRFLRHWVMTHGDFSTVEHHVISADLLVDRGISHELVRHRIAKYNDTDIDVAPPEVTQESTRFVNYGKRGEGITVILPPELEPVHGLLEGKPAYHDAERIMESGLIPPEPNKVDYVAKKADYLAKWYRSWTAGVAVSESQYLFQVNELKVPPELARDMLPHCTATRMITTNNMRNWRHLLIMRTTQETHRKLRPLMGGLLEQLKATVPILFEDLTYEMKQSENLRKGR